MDMDVMEDGERILVVDGGIYCGETKGVDEIGV